MKKRILLLDGHSLIYRAFHALKQAGLRDENGEPVWAVYGFLRMLLLLIKKQQPDGIGCTMDTPGETFRHDIQDDYKDNRPEMPDELKPQVRKIDELLKTLDIPVYTQGDYESDDLLATAVRQLKEQGFDGEIFIVTNDKDCFQMVDDDQVRILKTKQGVSELQTLDTDVVKDETGVAPDRIAEWLALTGDQSDNIPGVPGVGPTYAERLLNDYESLDAVFEDPDGVEETLSERLRDNIFDNEEAVRQALSLTVLQTDGDIEVTVDELTFEGLDAHRDKLIEFCREHDFYSMIDELGSDETVPEWDRFDDTVTDINQADFLSRAKKAVEVTLYIPGTSAEVRKAETLDLYAKLDDEVVRTEIDESVSAEKLRLAVDAPGTFVFQGKRLQMWFLKLDGQVVDEPAWFDCQIASYLQGPEKDHELDDVVKRTLSVNVDDDEPTEQPGRTVRAISRMGDKLAEDLDSKRQTLLYEMEQPLTGILAKMEKVGIVLDDEYFGELLEEVRADRKELHEKVCEAANREDLNPNSPKQLREVLFEELDLPVQETTGTGKPSTNEDTLEVLRNEHELPDLILQYRSKKKVESTYLEPFLEHQEDDGRIHTQLNQTITATGRLSSSDPNLQNIPLHSELGHRVRRGFIAPEGRTFLAADYSQVEMRILAHISGDERLQAIFQEDRDIHSETAADLFEIETEVVTENQRTVAKAVNYGIAYGLSAWGLANNTDLDVDQDEAEEYIERYFERYPGVKNYIDETVERARDQGYIETARGRRRDIPELHSSNYTQRQFGERVAVNAPIQGLSADILKEDMLELRPYMADLPGEMLLQIHDEILFEVDHDGVEGVREAVGEVMGSGHGLDVPIEIEAKTGANWDAVSK